ncbi:MAG: GNAT family N-acetyltransferase [Anaerolineae bacterium]|nr:MAG: GNAT family N-acetyltransferase [Anaerolineae bacterium]
MEYTLLTSPKDLDALATTWNTLLEESVTNTPFLRHEYLRAWWQTLGGGEWPQGELAIVLAYQDGELIGIAPFFLTDYEGAPALLLLGSIEISDFLDLIVRPQHLRPFLGGLLDFLDQHGPPGWRALYLHNVPDTSPTLEALRNEVTRRGWTFEKEVLQPAPYIPLPGDWEAYLAGINKKQRHEIRRKMRRAENYAKPVRWYIVEDEATLDDAIEACCHLMAQDPEKQAFLTQTMRSQMRLAIHAAFRAGWLQLAFLEVDGEKAAGYLNFDYNNRIWVYNSGLDQRFRELSPGWVLLGHLLKWANENGRSEFDFMRGDEEYKYRFGAVNRYVLRAKVTR